MYRAALRSSPRALRGIRQSNLSAAPRRYLTTPPAAKGRTWKSSAARWGLAITAVYWYSTSPIFADEPTSRTGPAPPQFSDSDLPTVDAVIEEKRRQTRAAAPHPPEPSPTQQTMAEPRGEEGTGQESAEALEEEASQQGAFNPETGEINWDCPCLGGMADGPCGEEFKAAFSCFVYSSEEPKGMECIDKFQHMRDCFRQYPEIYGAELEDDDDDEPAAPVAGAGTGDGDVPESSTPQPVEKLSKIADSTSPTEPPADRTEPAQESREATSELVQELKEATSEPEPEGTIIPKKAVDATDANVVSYAEIASKGPKQSPEEAAAPQPPQVASSEAASTASLVDVDTPSVRTVPSDFAEQDVQTETQANRRDREDEEAAARAEADLARKQKAAASSRARRADNWITRQLAGLSDGAGATLVTGNWIAVAALSGWLGYKAWGLHERGRLGWSNIGIGLGVLGAVGAFEGVFANYFQKAKSKKQ